MSYSFPTDLLEAQRELLEVSAAYAALCRKLPWSVTAADGFESLTGNWKFSRPDTPGYDADEIAEERRLRERRFELSRVVHTHRYWGEFSGSKLVEARMALKHAHGAEPTAA